MADLKYGYDKSFKYDNDGRLMYKEKSFHYFSVLVACNEYTWILVGGLWESVIYIIYCLKVWC